MFSVSPQHNCCTTQPKGKALCPYCQKEAKGVLSKTLEHLLKNTVRSTLSSLEGYYYCKTASCKVVYFKEDDILTQEDLSVEVGLKEGVSPATLCYCFHWSKENIQKELEISGNTKALEEIKAKMKDPGCSCEILNPSGGCCLADVQKFIHEAKSSL